MFVLFETAAGYGLFKVNDEGKVKNADDIAKHFDTPSAAQKLVSLHKFRKFKNTADALQATTAVLEGKLEGGLKKFLKKEVDGKLMVGDSKLATLVKEKLNIPTTFSSESSELIRGIRSQLDSLLTEVDANDLKAMTLGLSHSLSRFKLKFSPDKVDVMIVQAIALLDDLDKELNTYAMRVKEWYGWHFPEMGKIITDNILYAKSVKAMGMRTNAGNTSFSAFLPEELEAELKEGATVSMGTEISCEDLENIEALCDQVLAIGEYRAQLYEYLKNRMEAIAPNLTVLVGELVGARLIAHAGSLMNLAKHPASTVQILGAEKALFRALKTKHATPKYGLIYHASLVGQCSAKVKGKISRLLAAKSSLSTRVDALGDKDSPAIGIENRAKVEARLRELEGRPAKRLSGVTKTPTKYDPTTQAGVKRSSNKYNDASDFTLKKEKDADEMEVDTPKKKSKKAEATPDPTEEKKKKKKKRDSAMEEAATPKAEDGEKKKKKKRSVEEVVEEVVSPKKRKTDGDDGAKKKKKKKSSE
mmetsp:Transcript_10245/g.25741  ORF Transcript_10245/g.25741 Transcript_10245/m.25741 type:complete len:531 (-) Transcript_10245:63-1655(-)|eukprot:CAMPEP_0177655934 /NCGR_PEP_ID=MMETSP0447-20121125/15260_1 /TAXON_ID=0 /ORGANISM="Stygamoeba regulata, Strain BSH-02190019" /LENGTH=530 /DNA_ID=CAMNT_0019159943 /DNA_START=108 /DNA_END=1700 /DNA_ORIENTATION=+